MDKNKSVSASLARQKLGAPEDAREERPLETGAKVCIMDDLQNLLQWIQRVWLGNCPHTPSLNARNCSGCQDNRPGHITGILQSVESTCDRIKSTFRKGFHPEEVVR